LTIKQKYINQSVAYFVYILSVFMIKYNTPPLVSLWYLVRGPSKIVCTQGPKFGAKSLNTGTEQFFNFSTKDKTNSLKCLPKPRISVSTKLKWRIHWPVTLHGQTAGFWRIWSVDLIKHKWI